MEVEQKEQAFPNQIKAPVPVQKQEDVPYYPDEGDLFMESMKIVEEKKKEEVPKKKREKNKMVVAEVAYATPSDNYQSLSLEE